MEEQIKLLRQTISELQDSSDAPVSPQQLLTALDCLAELLDHVEQSQKRSMQRQVEYDHRLLAIENSQFFRLLRFPGRLLLDWRGWLGQVFLRSPLHSVYLKVARPRANQSRYQHWLESERPPEMKPLARRPLISIVLAVYSPQHQLLETTIESVLGQTYPSWQLCACDISTDSWVRNYFADKCATDMRIRFRHLEEPAGGLPLLVNHASTLTEGEYVCFLEQNDVLAPYALYCIAEAIQDGWPDLLYTDEDHLEGGRRVRPIFKPGYSPDLLRCCMYMANLLIVRKAKLDELGWLRTGLDGSHYYDLALRTIQTSKAVRHIPRILYHSRRPANPMAGTDPNTINGKKRVIHESGRQALVEHVRPRDAYATVEDGPVPATYHVHWSVPSTARVSIVICSRKPTLLKRCLAGIERTTTNANREFVVVQHEMGDAHAWEDINRLHKVIWVRYRGPFHFARMNNLGAQRASGDVLLFLNDDIIPISRGWLTDVVAQALRDEVAVAGAKLVYPSGAIQHAGIVTNLGAFHSVRHLHRDTFASADWDWLPFTRNVSAVTGACMAMRRSVFEELGGFDEIFPVNYNDTDLCLRARQAGYEVVIEPRAVLRHSECGTRSPGVGVEERELWEDRWGERLKFPDLFYSPNLSQSCEAAILDPSEFPSDLRPRP
jgi:GT2 family glycosyltransferase